MGKTAGETGAANAAPETVEQLKEQLAACDQALQAKENECVELRAKIEEQEAELAVARETLTELQAQLETAETKAAAKADEIVVEKQTYLVDAGNFNFKGEVVNAEVLKKNPKLAKDLIDLGVGFIKKKGA